MDVANAPMVGPVDGHAAIDIDRHSSSGVKPFRICFVAPSAYPVLSGDRSIQFVGGAQVQQCILARELVLRGHSVSMICMNYGQDEGVVIDGIRVHRMHTPDGGWPGIRFIHPRLTSVWAAMRRANADIYYQRTAGALTAFVVAFAKAHCRRSIYAAASDRDFLAQTPHVQFARDRLLYRWGVRNADYVVAQTDGQQDACERTFGRTPTVIRSCYSHRGQPGDRVGPIIWVGNVIPVKRAELFVQLAAKLPQYRFKLIGGSDGQRFESLRALAATVPNVELTGFVPFADVECHFDRASILINTSSYEGFPNTFLQAWSRGIPTISFFDPRAHVGSEQVGSVSENIEDMIAQVENMKQNPALWEMKGRLASIYFEETFSIQRAADAYESMLTSPEEYQYEEPR